MDLIDTETILTNLNTIFNFILILFITFLFAGIINKMLRSYFKKKTRRLKVDATQYSVFSRLIVLFVYLIGIFLALYTLPQFKTISLSFFASAGIIAAIVGFASQKAFSNIISGIVIASNEPFRVGDIIQVDNFFGTVEDITLWHTIIVNFENKRIILPNSKIAEATIENYNIFDNRVCKFLEMDISYDSDVDKAMAIMKEEILAHPLFFDKRSDEEKAQGKEALKIKLIGFKESAITLRAWVWTKDPSSAFHLSWDMYKKLKERFESEGIEIPYPHRTIVYKTDLRHELDDAEQKTIAEEKSRYSAKAGKTKPKRKKSKKRNKKS